MGWDKKVDAATKMTFMLDKKRVMKKILDKGKAGDFVGKNLEHSVDGLNFGDSEFVPHKRHSGYPCDDMNETGPSSSFVISNDMSQHLNNNVDRWMTSTSETGVQGVSVGDRVPTMQRSTLASRSSLSMARAWCVLALALPLFSFNTPGAWRCSPSQVLSSAELFLANIATVVGRARANVSRIAQQQMTRDCFAMAMDIVLVIYAFGFLLLSLYQASVIG